MTTFMGISANPAGWALIVLIVSWAISALVTRSILAPESYTRKHYLVPNADNVSDTEVIWSLVLGPIMMAYAVYLWREAHK